MRDTSENLDAIAGKRDQLVSKVIVSIDRIPMPLSNSLARTALLGAVLALCSTALHAQEEGGAPLKVPKSWEAKPSDPAIAPSTEKPSPSEPKQPKNYALPALEIIGFDVLLNQYDRLVYVSEFNSNLTSINNNLRGSWVTDDDPYKVNQIGHPYQGSMYHGFARSAGLSYWESAGYTFAGSALWEVAGETTRPSYNDQIASGIAGSFFGEALFRMASLVLEQGGGMSPSWREWTASAISPSMGFNRHVKGYKSIFSSRNAPYYSRLSLGYSSETQNIAGSSTNVKANEAQADFSLDYGMPGKSGYEYTRPFDYFTLQATATSANLFESIMTRGLLYGKNYEAGSNYRGVWGVYGSYDYIAPQIYRISSTALSLGTTGQSWLSKNIALQGTGLVGAGYAAVGTSHSSAEGEYHYGVEPQALLALRLIIGNKASIDLTGREYFVVTPNEERDNIMRTDIAFTWRILRQHAVSLRYLWNRRDATYTTLGDVTQSRTTLGIYYTMLGSDRFGAVDW